MTTVDQVLDAMITYYGPDARRINHFLKVYGFAKQIAAQEGVDGYTQELVEITGLTHDIGIKIAEDKYQSAAGKYQEQEGPAEAKKMLQALHVDDKIIEDICYIIGHHHTYTHIDTLAYQIIVEADFVVNAFEDGLSKEAIQKVYDRIFKTASGKQLLKGLYL